MKLSYSLLCRIWHLSDRSLDLSSSAVTAFGKNLCPALGPAPINAFIRVLNMIIWVYSRQKVFKQESERLFHHFALVGVRVGGLGGILLILVSVAILHWNDWHKHSDSAFIWIKAQSTVTPHVWHRDIQQKWQIYGICVFSRLKQMLSVKVLPTLFIIIYNTSFQNMYFLMHQHLCILRTYHSFTASKYDNLSYNGEYLNL